MYRELNGSEARLVVGPSIIGARNGYRDNPHSRFVHRPHNPLPASLATSYYKDIYRRMLAEMRKQPDPRRRFILDHQGMRIADVGCGDGSMTSDLLRRNQVWGIDIEPKPRKKYMESGLKVLNRNLNKGLTGIPAGSFDTVYFLDVLEHMQEPHKLLTDIAAILKPGGILILTTPIYQENKWEENRLFHETMASRAGIDTDVIKQWSYEPEIAIFGLDALIDTLVRDCRMSLFTRAIGYSFDDPKALIQGPDVAFAENVALFCIKEDSPRLPYHETITRQVARGHLSEYELLGHIPYPLKKPGQKNPGLKNSPIRLIPLS